MELFAGAAGLAQGFLRTQRYELLALSDIDSNAKATFNENFGSIPYIVSDIHDLTPEQVKDSADGRRIVGVLGGPPCQGFSLAGLKNPDDQRNQHIADYIRFVAALDPDFLLMENVPQLLFHPSFQKLLEDLKPAYDVRYAVLNAARYGVPQTRHRAFVLAFHKRLAVMPSFPAPTNGFTRLAFDYCRQRLVRPGDETMEAEILGADPIIRHRPELLGVLGPTATPMKPFVTIADALSDLRPVENGETLKQYISSARTSFQRIARRGCQELFNHAARRHDASMIELIGLIPEGGDLSNVDKRYWPKSHYSQAYGRLHRRGLARTITTFFCNPGSGRFLHPQDHRTLTVREAARLQGFDDRFVFLGTQEQQMRLVGNAVPLPLAQAIGDRIWADIGHQLKCATHTP